MRCHICDKALTEAEIQYIPQTKEFDCCSTCLEVAMDAAYCDGFVKEDPLDDPELEEQFGNGATEILDPDTYRSTFDHSDYGDGDDYDYP
jgi:hypothetical protein